MFTSSGPWNLTTCQWGPGKPSVTPDKERKSNVTRAAGVTKKRHVATAAPADNGVGALSAELKKKNDGVTHPMTPALDLDQTTIAAPTGPTDRAASCRRSEDQRGGSKEEEQQIKKERKFSSRPKRRFRRQGNSRRKKRRLCEKRIFSRQKWSGKLNGEQGEQKLKKVTEKKAKAEQAESSSSTSSSAITKNDNVPVSQMRDRILKARGGPGRRGGGAGRGGRGPPPQSKGATASALHSRTDRAKILQQQRQQQRRLLSALKSELLWRLETTSCFS